MSSFPFNLIANSLSDLKGGFHIIRGQEKKRGDIMGAPNTSISIPRSTPRERENYETKKNMAGYIHHKSQLLCSAYNLFRGTHVTCIHAFYLFFSSPSIWHDLVELNTKKKTFFFELHRLVWKSRAKDRKKRRQDLKYPPRLFFFSFLWVKILRCCVVDSHIS